MEAFHPHATLGLPDHAGDYGYSDREIAGDHGGRSGGGGQRTTLVHGRAEERSRMFGERPVCVCESLGEALRKEGAWLECQSLGVGDWIQEGVMGTEDVELFDRLASFSNKNLIDELTRRIGTPITTSINIFINSDGYEIRETNRSPESLKSFGVSMRNVFGEYIK